MTLANNRLVKTFAELRAAGRQTLLPFITAGYPSIEATEALLRKFDALGVRMCELGIPFSDPIADGPVIQASYTDALAAGVTTEKIFNMVREFRAAGGKLALLAMISYSLVWRQGPADFVSRAAEAGFDGLIVPDLPVDESGPMERLAEQAGLAEVLLIAPTTPLARQVDIAGHSRGFIYYVSVAGITGERDGLPADTVRAVAELRRHTDTPVCVGFGISNPQTVAEVCGVADAAIVGSAIVRRISDHKDQAPDALAESVGAFVGDLLEPVA